MLSVDDVYSPCSERVLNVDDVYSPCSERVLSFECLFVLSVCGDRAVNIQLFTSVC